MTRASYKLLCQIKSGEDGVKPEDKSYLPVSFIHLKVDILLMESSQDRAKTDEVSKFIFTASNSAILDLLSAIFNIEFNKDEVEISQVSSEYISGKPKFERSSPDIVLGIRDKEKNTLLFHVEIQTKYNSFMDLRMVKYGYLIGTSGSEINDEFVRTITIPHQVVIYLEENKKIRDELVIKIILPDEKELDYKVQVLRLYKYTSLELKEKNLYLILPLILVKYRKGLDKIARKDKIDAEALNIIVEEILREVTCITRISDKYLDEGIIDDQTKDIILSATMEIYNQLHEKYIRDNTVKDKVENMIESVAQKFSQKKYFSILEEGKSIGIEEGKSIGIEKGKSIGIEEGKSIGIEKGKSIGIEEGKSIGLEEGKTEAMETIAKNLIMLGMDDTLIEKATGLSLKMIEHIRSRY